MILLLLDIGGYGGGSTSDSGTGRGATAAAGHHADTETRSLWPLVPQHNGSSEEPSVMVTDAEGSVSSGMRQKRWYVRTGSDTPRFLLCLHSQYSASLSSSYQSRVKKNGVSAQRKGKVF